jgi:hypothetical protein
MDEFPNGWMDGWIIDGLIVEREKCHMEGPLEQHVNNLLL